MGVKSIIRVGTAGGLQDDAKIGASRSHCSLRQEGTSNMMVPAAFPAVADPEMTLALATALKDQGRSFHHGIVVSSDLFYPALLPNDLELYKKANAVAVEMECSALFVVGTLRKVRMGSVLALDGNPLRWDQGVYDPHSNAMDLAIRAAIAASLDAIVKF